MNRAELALIGDGHVDHDGNPPHLFGINADGRVGTREFRFESMDGQHFTVLEGERYTIRYTEEPLRTEKGTVKSVQGHAFRDNEGHLLLTESTIQYHKKYDRTSPHASTFVTGYIPGVQIIHDGCVVFEWPVDKSRIAQLVDSLVKKSPINLLTGIKMKFPNSSQYPTM